MGIFDNIKSAFGIKKAIAPPPISKIQSKVSISSSGSSSSASQKNILIQTFNKKYFELFDIIISIFPEDVEIISGKNGCKVFLKNNVSLLIKFWYNFVGSDNEIVENIKNGEMDYFVEKDFSENVTKVIEVLAESKIIVKETDIMEMIKNFREPLKKMKKEDQDKIMVELCTLNNISRKYSKL